MYSNISRAVILTVLSVQYRNIANKIPKRHQAGLLGCSKNSKKATTITKLKPHNIHPKNGNAALIVMATIFSLFLTPTPADFPNFRTHI